MNNATHKNGPIHFYPTNERAAYVANVVEYCVQIGERQSLTKSQAAWLITDKQVSVDGSIVTDLSKEIEPGARQVNVRGRTHHVMVHQPIYE